MPDRLRPLLAALRPWAGVLAGAAVALAGLLAALSSFGVTRSLALLVLLLGLALAWTARQRLRWVRDLGQGPGLVEADERRLTYWGPQVGGAFDLDDLRRLDLAADPPRWVLQGAPGQRLEVPVAAQGSEALLDLFAALPGLSVERLLAARDAGAPATVWRRDAHLGVVR